MKYLYFNKIIEAIVRSIISIPIFTKGPSEKGFITWVPDLLSPEKFHENNRRFHYCINNKNKN